MERTENGDQKWGSEMKITSFLQPLFILLLLLLTSIRSAEGFVDTSYEKKSSPIQISITTDKSTYFVGEPIKGAVVLTNIYPVGIPAAFKTELYHNDQLVKQSITAVPYLPLGTTRFRMDHFGIPAFNQTPDSVGEWSIRVHQQTMDEPAAPEAVIKIIPKPDP